MATKKTGTAKAEPKPQVEEIAVEQEVVTAPKQKVEKPVKPEWEIKDRTYILKGNKEPITYTIQSRHSKKYSLLYFDPEKKEQRELRYATNQSSVFVDEQKGEATLGHIVFRDGVLTVPKEKQNLQKLLSLYHPALNKKYYEFNPVQIATDDLDYIEVELDALNAARAMDVDEAEAILRVELGSKVSKMTSKEIKRDLMLFAKKNPALFIELANDENVHLRNVAIKATEFGLLKLSKDQRSFHWGSNDRKLMNVPFDENPYSAMAAWFKTDEGMDVYRNIDKNLK
jgi:hypothetical protein